MACHGAKAPDHRLSSLRGPEAAPLKA
jgi:hypothetical protein